MLLTELGAMLFMLATSFPVDLEWYSELYRVDGVESSTELRSGTVTNQRGWGERRETGRVWVEARTDLVSAVQEFEFFRDVLFSLLGHERCMLTCGAATLFRVGSHKSLVCTQTGDCFVPLNMSRNLPRCNSRCDLNNPSFPFEYFAPEAKTSATELVPDPISKTRHDTTPTVIEESLLFRKAAEALHLDLKLLSLLVHELGGDWIATRVSELTTIPSSDIRGLHVNGVSLRPLQRGTLVQSWRSLLESAGFPPPALGAPLPQLPPTQGLVASGTEAHRGTLGFGPDRVWVTVK